MGATAGFKERARVSGETPIGAASFRQQNIQTSIQSPLPAFRTTRSLSPLPLHPSVVMQMCGRAGRQGLDTHGVAVIMTTPGKVCRYQQIAYDCALVPLWGFLVRRGGWVHHQTAHRHVARR